MKKYTVMVDGHVYLDVEVKAKSLEDAVNRLDKAGGDSVGVDFNKFLKPGIIWNDGLVEINGVWETKLPDRRGY